MNRKSVAIDESTGRTRTRSLEDREDPIMRAWLEAQVDDPSKRDKDKRIGWQEIERHVLRLQRQLAYAVEQDNRKAVRHYKWLIRISHHVKLLAVRHVTQENCGRQTPGVDGKIYTTARQRRNWLKLSIFIANPLPCVACMYVRRMVNSGRSEFPLFTIGRVMPFTRWPWSRNGICNSRPTCTDSVQIDPRGMR